MAELPSQHRDLAAVVGIVGNQIAEKNRDVGAKSLHPPFAAQDTAKTTLRA